MLRSLTLFNSNLAFSKPSAASSTAISAVSNPSRLSILQSENLDILEWSSVCNRLAAQVSTPMGVAAAQNAVIPFGNSKSESLKLLNQTAAAISAVEDFGSPPSDLRSVDDVTSIVTAAVSGQLITVNELCTVRRTLIAGKALFEKIDSDSRYLPLIEIFDGCDFLVKMESTIGMCIDCNLLEILDTASEDLEIIRFQKKWNMERLDALLKEMSLKIFKAGGIDSPLVTKRRARMCVGVRARYKHLVPDGVVLDTSSSGATYFVEPGAAVELNNMEVKLSNPEKAEEIGILSFLTSEVAKSEKEIVYLLDKIVEVDLAFARAMYARWMNGGTPYFQLQG